MKTIVAPISEQNYMVSEAPVVAGDRLAAKVRPISVTFSVPEPFWDGLGTPPAAGPGKTETDFGSIFGPGTVLERFGEIFGCWRCLPGAGKRARSSGLQRISWILSETHGSEPVAQNGAGGWGGGWGLQSCPISGR